MDVARRVAVKALESGAKRDSVGAIEADFAASCQAPQMVSLVGRREMEFSDERYRYSADGMTSMEVNMWTRCRKCEACLKHRARLWTARAKAEINYSPRTWFGTLTLAPEHHQRAQVAAWVRERTRGCEFDRLTEGEKFCALDRQIFPHIRKMLGRIRKNSGARIRYLCVTEAHKSGLPHYHLLVHETARDEEVKYAHIGYSWPLGHSQFRLVSDARPASYVGKYVSKDARARVRASGAYGNYIRPAS